MSACTKIKQNKKRKNEKKKNKKQRNETKIYGVLNLAHSGMKLRLDMALMCHPGTVYMFSTVQNACIQNKNMVLLKHSIFKPY